ncbi:hypothetical protein E2562_038720 [Oryza meyeriana var. granulata]|uniref:UDP-glycosyltransferases domain-containing protein n=1 Tax=Oryza meyeriana var. granulata TaxID=110450 RepID=A0A6G1C2Z1_9ORYZ|nr:hypothetical protein E2562_038720 [Oryza meyeriana var. granulata]
MMKLAKLLTDGYLDTVVDGARGMCDGIQLRDLPSFIRTTNHGDIMLTFIKYEAESLTLPDAVILDTFDDLERPALDTMRAILPPVYIASNLWKEQDGLLEWLDGRPPRSVVYVNYGSITVMTNEQLLEFACGLVNSDYPFLWNVRPDLVKGDTAVLPPEFLAAVEGRGLLTTWCPQEQVIEHPAVADQLPLQGYKRTEWGVGMEIGGEVRRGELAGTIREAMEGEKGREMRWRASEWKEMAKRVTLPGGPAESNLTRLINQMLSVVGKKVQTVDVD